MPAATLAAPLFVQTQFNWDDEPIGSVSVAREVDRDQRSIPTVSSTTAKSTFGKSTLSRARQPDASDSGSRIGGCVHVGAPLVKVLSKYGFSLDDLLEEIDRQKKIAS